MLPFASRLKALTWPRTPGDTGDQLADLRARPGRQRSVQVVQRTVDVEERRADTGARQGAARPWQAGQARHCTSTDKSSRYQVGMKCRCTCLLCSR